MIDFVKIRIINPDIQSIRQNTLLVWHELTNKRTREITKEIAIYNGLTFEIKGNRYLSISGSIHKYWNNYTFGLDHNYNAFTHKSLTDSIQDICNKFKIDPSQSYFENIELK